MIKRSHRLPLTAVLTFLTIALLSTIGCTQGGSQAESISSESGNLPVSDPIATAPPPTATAVPSPTPYQNRSPSNPRSK